MTSIEIEFPNVVSRDKEFNEEWDRMFSFTRAVMDEAGVVVERVQDDEVGEYIRIAL